MNPRDMVINVTRKTLEIEFETVSFKGSIIFSDCSGSGTKLPARFFVSSLSTSIVRLGVLDSPSRVTGEIMVGRPSGRRGSSRLFIPTDSRPPIAVVGPCQLSSGLSGSSFVRPALIQPDLEFLMTFNGRIIRYGFTHEGKDHSLKSLSENATPSTATTQGLRSYKT